MAMIGGVINKDINDVEFVDFVKKSNYNEEILASIISLGQIGDKKSISLLKEMLNHEEPNIRWDSAIALAKMDDYSGKIIINDLLNY